jgi:hypothetical protein
MNTRNVQILASLIALGFAFPLPTASAQSLSVVSLTIAACPLAFADAIRAGPLNGIGPEPGLSLAWLSEQLSDIVGTPKRLEQLKKKPNQEEVRIEREGRALKAEKARLTRERAAFDARRKKASRGGLRLGHQDR